MEYSSICNESKLCGWIILNKTIFQTVKYKKILIDFRQSMLGFNMASTMQF